MPTRTVQVNITGNNQAGAAFKSLAGDVQHAQSFLERFTSSLGSIPQKLATFGLAVQGFQSIVSGLKGLGEGIGIGLQMEMEDVHAKFMAFYKDEGKVSAALAEVRAEANKTPFSFREMSTAAGALIPVARAANEPLMDLVKTAEILGASNPMQGLEGAAFALREAVSGDFTSLIARFDMPRSMINDLKAQGLPNIQIVRKALANMGFDMDLVAGKANTLAGRWSTFNDSIDTVKMTISQPIFDAMKEGLIGLQSILDNNQVAIGKWAEGVAAGITSVIAFVTNGAKRIIYVFRGLSEYLSAGNQRDVMREWFGDFGPTIDNVVRTIKRVKGEIADVISIVRSFGDALSTGKMLAWVGAWAAAERVFGGEIPDAFHTAIGALASLSDLLRGGSLARFFEGLGESVGELGPKFDKLSGFLFLVSDNASDARGTLYNLAGVFDTVFGKLTGTEGSKLGTPFASLIGVIKSVNFGPIVQGAWDLYQAFKSFTIIDNIIEFIKGFSSGGLEGGFAAVSKNITGAFSTLKTTLAPIFQGVLDWISTQGPAVLAALQPWLTSIKEWATQTASGASEYLAPFITSVTEWVKAQAPVLVASFTSWINAFFQWLPGAVGKFVSEWPAQFDQMLTSIESGDFAPALATWAEQFLAWVVEVGPQIVVALPAIMLAIFGWITSTAATLLTHIITKWVPAFVVWVATKAVPLLIEGLGKLLEAMVLWIQGVAPKIEPDLIALANSFIGWVVGTALPGLTLALAKVLRELLTWIGNTAKSVSLSAVDMGKQLITGFLNGLAGLGKQLTEKILNELRNINIDLGWIKISGGAISFNFPSITGSGTSATAAPTGSAPSIEASPQATPNGVPILSGTQSLGATPGNVPSLGGTRSLGSVQAGGVTVIFEQPVYGMADFEDAVIGAVDQAQRRGRAVWAVPA